MRSITNPPHTKFFLTLLCVLILPLTAQQGQPVDLPALLPEGAMQEITHGNPDFKVTIVPRKGDNADVAFGQNYIRVDGVKDDALRERLAKYVLQYLENPNKKAEDKAKRDAYAKLPPEEKMKQFVERMRKHYPDFDYKWVHLGEGNTDIEYGDNGLTLIGVEKPGSKSEIAHAIFRLQKEIDKHHKEEQKQ